MPAVVQAGDLTFRPQGVESGQGCRHRPKTKLMAAFVIAIVVAP
jgi:hypothetical protein